jgi:NADH-quinone oxidoreductase subunit N
VTGNALANGIDVALVAPEAALAVGLVAVLAGDLSPAARARGVAPWLGVLACAVALAFAATGTRGAVGSMVTVDALAVLARWLVLPVTALVLLAGAGERRDPRDGGAWTAAVLGLALGASVTAAAAGCVTLWLGLELLALSSYTLVAFRGGDRRSAEAGMKFVLFGGVVSAAMVFGISHVYGVTDHLDFAGIGHALANGAPAGAGLALVLALAGVAYKLTLVPLHFYAPDVYQGSPALGVAAVSTLPKIAAATALVRCVQLAVPPGFVAPGAFATGVAVLAATSMLFASFTAVVQRDAKRIVAFSGIGHGAAVVLAVACLPGAAAIAAAGFYLLTYVGANVGALVCLAVLERRAGSTRLDALAGSWQRQPWVASLLCLFLLSLAGVPPLAGFLGKWGVLQQALAAGGGAGGVPALAITALLFLLATAVSAWSYLLVVRAVVFASAPAPAGAASGAQPARERLSPATAVVLAACVAATLGLGLWLDGLAQLRAAL